MIRSASDDADDERPAPVSRLIDTCPEGGTVLDAAWGTGPYVGQVLSAGRQVVGTDQSSGMLAQARSKVSAGA
jgi:ubiquinone/menaquinone biosynthesis C-methylase UbiE